MRRLTKRQILKLHEDIAVISGGSAELRDTALLESALAAPWQEFAGIVEYPTIEEKAARLGFGLIANHPFVDGNKRIGAHAMLVFLAVNGVALCYEQDELVDVIMKLAQGNFGCEELLAWIRAHKM